MADSDSVLLWLQRWQEGDAQAADQLFLRYVRSLAGIADQHLNQRLRAREDGEDVVQSVFRTFFRRLAEGEFQIGGAAQLWQLLVTITLLKVRAHARQHTAQKRDVRAEAPGVADSVFADLAAPEPGPLEALTFVDLLEVVLRDLPAFHGQLLELRLRGCTHREIAGRLGVSRQTVHRAVTILKRRLEQALAEEA